MDDYVRKTIPELLQKLEGHKQLTLVLGNESGDLDSVVSSVTLAWSRHSPDTPTLPLLNFAREDLALKTEVLFVFRQLVDLPVHHIPCLNDIEFSKILSKVNVILVDHNVIENPELAFLDPKVTEIYDHHKIDREIRSNLKKCQIEKVGSCSTLVAEAIFRNIPDPVDSRFLTLIRCTIILDTKNICPQTKKATAKDVQILDMVEDKLKKQGNLNEGRRHLLNRLLTAKGDVSGFSISMLIRKDMKVVYSSKGDKISVSTLPGYSCQDLLKRKTFLNDLKEFQSKYNMSNVILLGMGDLLVFPSKTSESEKVKRGLHEKVKDLEIIYKCITQGSDYYLRLGLSVSRKKILPCIKESIK